MTQVLSYVLLQPPLDGNPFKPGHLLCVALRLAAIMSRFDLNNTRPRRHIRLVHMPYYIDYSAGC
jgi:hypothetical protein